MIETRNLSKRYGNTQALHPTSLTMPNGQVTVLIGPSGCGKSTLLRLILRLIEPDGGETLINDESVTPESSQAIRRKVGYVIQDGGLFPHLTARQNVTLLGEHLGHGVDVSHLADLVRFPKDGLDRYPVELSGGQRQRVGLMRALALDPPTLLLDEPLGALDPLVRASLQTDLKDIFGSLKKTVVLVTHDMGEAAYLGQQIVLMKEGKVIQVGSLEDFQSRPSDTYVTEFMNAQRSLVTL